MIRKMIRKILHWFRHEWGDVQWDWKNLENGYRTKTAFAVCKVCGLKHYSMKHFFRDLKKAGLK